MSEKTYLNYLPLVTVADTLPITFLISEISNMEIQKKFSEEVSKFLKGYIGEKSLFTWKDELHISKYRLHDELIFEIDKKRSSVLELYDLLVKNIDLTSRFSPQLLETLENTILEDYTNLMQDKEISNDIDGYRNYLKVLGPWAWKRGLNKAIKKDLEKSRQTFYWNPEDD